MSSIWYPLFLSIYQLIDLFYWCYSYFKLQIFHWSQLFPSSMLSQIKFFGLFCPSLNCFLSCQIDLESCKISSLLVLSYIKNLHNEKFNHFLFAKSFDLISFWAFVNPRLHLFALQLHTFPASNGRDCYRPFHFNSKTLTTTKN